MHASPQTYMGISNTFPKLCQVHWDGPYRLGYGHKMQVEIWSHQIVTIHWVTLTSDLGFR